MINKLKTSTAGARYKAANILIVAFPTETVYGLGADARNEEAVLKVFRVKKRPSFNPLIIHLADIELAKRQAEFNALAIYVAEVFWPGPLTLVLPRASDCNVSRIACAGLKTLAFCCLLKDVSASLSV